MLFLQYLAPIVALAIGCAPLNVHAVPLLEGVDGIGGLGSLDGVTNGNIGELLGSLGAGLGGGGGGVLRRTKPQPEYINSPQAATTASCNVGTPQCCQSLHQTSGFRSQAGVGALLAMVPLDDLMVGLQCSPIAGGLLGIGGASTCNSQPVCCSGNTYEGLINIGCSPISL